MTSPMPADPTRLKLYVVVTGDSNSGKTSVIRRFVNNYFPKNPPTRSGGSTVGAGGLRPLRATTKKGIAGLEYALKLVTVREGGEAASSVVLQIADDEDTACSGREDDRCGYQLSTCCQKANGALMLFDSSAEDFDAALARCAQRKLEFDGDVLFRNGDKLPVVLVAAKSDEAKTLDENALADFAAAHGFVASFAVSAKSGQGVTEAFDSLATNMMKCQDRWREDRMSYEDIFVENCACG